MKTDMQLKPGKGIARIHELISQEAPAWKQGEVFQQIKNHLEANNVSFKQWVLGSEFGKTQVYAKLNEFKHHDESETTESVVATPKSKTSESHSTVGLSQATGGFDYSNLPAEDQTFLANEDRRMLHLYRNYSLDVGEILSSARDHFTSSRNGQQSQPEKDNQTFEQWFKSWGFSKTKAYDYIAQYNFIHQSQMVDGGDSELLTTFEKLPEKAKTKVAAKSTPEDLKKALLAADISSNKQYQQVVSEYNAAKQKAQELEQEKATAIEKGQALQQQLSETSQMAAKAQSQLLTSENTRHSVEAKLRDLEENPQTVKAVPEDYDQMKIEHQQLIDKVAKLTNERDDSIEKAAGLEDQLAEKGFQQDVQREAVENELTSKKEKISELDQQIAEGEKVLTQQGRLVEAQRNFRAFGEDIRQALTHGYQMLVPEDLGLFQDGSDQIQAIRDVFEVMHQFLDTGEDLVDRSVGKNIHADTPTASTPSPSGDILDMGGHVLKPKEA